MYRREAVVELIKNACLAVKNVSLFKNKRFALNKMFQRNASKFAIFYVPIRKPL